MKETNDNDISIEANKALLGIQKGLLISVTGLFSLLIFGEKLGILMTFFLGLFFVFLGVLIINKSSNQYLQKSKGEDKDIIEE